jgi:hypothetical protein
VVLPADYSFTLDDGGIHTFTDTGLGETTLITPGDQILTVMDTADNTITGSTTITVNAGPAPAPHGQRPPPSSVQASPAQAEPPPRSEASTDEVAAAARRLISLHDGGISWLTVPWLWHQLRGGTESELADLFSEEDLLLA